MIRASKVVFVSKELEDSFNTLPENDFLKKSIIQAVKNLKENAFTGIHVPKRLIPEDYIRRWEIKNLWKYDLPRGWRLMYTVTSDNEVELISAILEWCDHKEYERRFKY